jgi:teichuronic acid biosynthesis glycosyltransferase TuaC
LTSERGTEGSPTVDKEAAAMGLPVVTVDVGDVAEMLSGVEPSAVVSFPDGDSDDHEAALVASLVERSAEILATGARSNGRAVLGWLDLPRIAERVVDVYRDVSSRGRGA